MLRTGPPSHPYYDFEKEKAISSSHAYRNKVRVWRVAPALFALGPLLVFLLAVSGQAQAGDLPAAQGSPTPILTEPTIIFQTWPTVATLPDTSTPAPPTPTTPDAPPATATSPVDMGIWTPTTQPAIEPPSTDTTTPVPWPTIVQPILPLGTAAVAPPSDTPESEAPTSAPTALPTRTRTATPSATPTSGWSPPGPDCSVKPGKAVLKLNVPYVHQVNDVANGADGNWACGPASVLMVLAYYQKLQPWPIYAAEHGLSVEPTSIPLPSRAPSSRATATPKEDMKADYAPYLTNVYTDAGHTYSATAPDPRGKRLAGLYGTISPSGLADWGSMKQVLQWSGLSTAYVSPTWDGVVAALKRGHPVLLGNDLTAAGHIMVAIGYTSNNQLIVNDPYGNRFTAGYGANDGDGVYYAWSCSRIRNALEVIGAYPPPTSTPSATPSPTLTVVGQAVAASNADAEPQPAPSATDTPRPASVNIYSLGPGANDALIQAGQSQSHPQPQLSPSVVGRPSPVVSPSTNPTSVVHLLAAQRSSARPSSWLLLPPTLLALAALGIMLTDWRKKRVATMPQSDVPLEEQ